ELAGDNPTQAATSAQTVMSIETQLAKASMTRVERRVPENIYHKTTMAQLKELAPNFNWDSYFHAIGLVNTGDINVAEPNFIKDLNTQLTAIPLEDWKTYLRWHVLNSAAPVLGKKFVDEDFDFSGRTLTGTKEILPRWKRCVTATDRALGDALGQVYVEKYFPPQAKARAVTMVQNLIAALKD